MRVRAVVWSTVASLSLVPVVAFAAFTTPSDLFKWLETQAINTIPVSVYMEAHGGAQNTYVSVWVKGKAQRDGDYSQGTANMTLDIMHNGITSRIRSQVIVDGLMVYGRIQNARNLDALGLPTEQLRGKTGKWFGLDLTKLYSAEDLANLQVQQTPEEQWNHAAEQLADIGLEMTGAELQELFYKQFVDTLFTISSTTHGGETVYTLNLKPDFADQLQTALPAIFMDHYADPTLAMDIAAALQDLQVAFRQESSFRLMEHISANNEWLRQDFNLLFVPTPEIKKELDFDYARVDMKATRMDPFTIHTPSSWEPIEEFLQTDYSGYESDYDYDLYDTPTVSGRQSGRMTEEQVRARREMERGLKNYMRPIK